MGSFAPRAQRMTAWISLAAFLAVLAMPMLPRLHTAARAEADCAGVGRAGGGLAIGTDTASPTGPDHCVMCHWLRAARSATVHPVASAVPPLAYEPVAVWPTVSAVGRLLVLERPSRAPPSAA
jgi:hypothetical protein